MKELALDPIRAGSATCWHADLDHRSFASASEPLSPAERERADRFVFRHDGARYRAAHGVLRRLLAARTGIAAEALRFATGPRGKPHLVDVPGIEFNLSHSRSALLIAIGDAVPLGVDVEQLRPLADALGLAAEYFTPAERRELARVHPSRRDRAFLTCWTRKEACLKAVGHGLTLPLDRFEVGVEPVPCTVELPTPDGPVRLALTPLPGPAGTVASLAECFQEEFA
ncbi:4'-phosphopantetheinyl transferase family protein [Xylophilus sp. GOD-11R]|uniref:4'-phosphopantetheinyl transferase family protein n=1 Tax=Xylophilus sp. GOD-11R TaxID=3089814 RepID=UPI00298D3768|nr:4'-phosphopantetheinyl transferase superfamily protein [Xylophilus sp. GOD-11R]WPB55476.1 4'-phosphopantetheinyl transferase superfamily protein [Xylophilus sp. GOD-11R]